MQIFANDKQHFYCFMEFYAMQLKKSRGKNLIIVPLCNWKWHYVFYGLLFQWILAFLLATGTICWNNKGKNTVTVKQ